MSEQEVKQNINIAWLGSIIFSIVIILCIWLLGPNLQHFTDNFLPDQGAEWYYWQLPARDVLTMLIVWIFYLGHQFSIWIAIFWAQKNLQHLRANPSTNLTKYNIATLLINAFFVVLHLLQTQIWYDGLAQDVPIWTSQGSVVVMLCLILVIENPRRGIFIGRKAGKPFTARASAFWRRNHPYIIAWALVYTFWFHPMDSGLQLLSGFFYMFLLFTQVSLAYTPIHLDRRWIITLESYVAIHAVFVAVYNTIEHGSADMWPMFFSGFAFMFVFTYMYALKVRKEVWYTITALFIGFIAWLYIPVPFGYGRDLTFLLRLETVWIPIVLYGLSAIFAAIAYLITKKEEKE